MYRILANHVDVILDSSVTGDVMPPDDSMIRRVMVLRAVVSKGKQRERIECKDARKLNYPRARSTLYF